MKRPLFAKVSHGIFPVLMSVVLSSACTFSNGTDQGTSSSTDTLSFYREAEPELKLEPDSSTIQWAQELEEGQHKDNAQSYVRADKARVEVNRRFKRIIDKTESYREVYNKWCSLMDLMIDYLVNETYGEPFYSMQPLEINADISRWYQSMMPQLDTDYDIIFDDMNYPESISGVADLKIDDAQKMIRIALEDWLRVRSNFAKTLQAKHRKSFDNHTGDLMNWYLKEIQGLTTTRNDNKITDY